MSFVLSSTVQMEQWNRLQPHLRQMMGDDEFSAWIQPLQAVQSSDTGIVLSAANPIVLDWVRDHLLPDIQAVGRSQFGRNFTIELQVDAPPPQTGTPPSDVERIQSLPLTERFLFEHFVVGPSNQFAHAAAESVAHRPGERYNPLFIYGGSGLGKTHLLHAIAHRCRRSAANPRVVYMTTETFVNELIRCIQQQKMTVFRQTFRDVDVLLLDDIQFIAGKERTQEEFFHTFNTLQSSGRQVVFTSDSKPADIPGLEERLRSRFLQGLLADIQPPDLETRCAILQEKARAAGWDLPEDVVLFISRRVQNNVRELEGYLNRTIAYAQLTNANITVDVVRQALSAMIPDERQVTHADVIRFVAQHYGVRVADLKSRSNRRSIALPRQVAMYLIRNLLELSFPEIGRLFSKHHSTVMYAVESVQKQRLSNPDFDATLTSFIEHFRTV
jgi:chromosomal replication initiator protein